MTNDAKWATLKGTDIASAVSDQWDNYIALANTAHSAADDVAEKDESGVVLDPATKADIDSKKSYHDNLVSSKTHAHDEKVVVDAEFHIASDGVVVGLRTEEYTKTDILAKLELGEIDIDAQGNITELQ